MFAWLALLSIKYGGGARRENCSGWGISEETSPLQPMFHMVAAPADVAVVATVAATPPLGVKLQTFLSWFFFHINNALEMHTFINLRILTLLTMLTYHLDELTARA